MGTIAVAPVPAAAGAAGDVDVIEFPNSGPMQIGARSPMLLVRIVGDLCIGNRQQLKQRVVDELAEGRRRVVLDFEQCGYIDGSGLGVLVSIARKVEAAGGWLIAAGMNEDLRTLCALTKMDTVLSIADRVIDALGAVE